MAPFPNKVTCGGCREDLSCVRTRFNLELRPRLVPKPVPFATSHILPAALVAMAVAMAMRITGLIFTKPPVLFYALCMHSLRKKRAATYKVYYHSHVREATLRPRWQKGGRDRTTRKPQRWVQSGACLSPDPSSPTTREPVPVPPARSCGGGRFVTEGRHVPNSWADVAAILGAAHSSDLQASTRRSSGAKGLGFPLRARLMVSIS